MGPNCDDYIEKELDIIKVYKYNYTRTLEERIGLRNFRVEAVITDLHNSWINNAGCRKH